MTAAAEPQGTWWSADPTGWANCAEPRLRPLYDAVLDRLPAATSVLDAGCGAGAFAALAAEHGHHISGLDAASGLIDLARSTQPSADFRTGDLQALPFSTDAFGATVAINSILYAERPQRALEELARVTAPGGRVIVTMGTGTASAACAAGIDPLLPPDAHASSRTSFSLHDRHHARATLAAAGLKLIRHDQVSYNITFADAEQAVAAQLPAGPVQAAIAHAGRPAVTDALKRYFRPLTNPRGTITMPAAYTVAVATT